MNSKNNVLLTVVLCVLVLIIGFVVGNFSSKYFGNDKDSNNNSLNSENKNEDLEENGVLDNSSDEKDENLIDNHVYSEDLNDIVGVYTAKIEFVDNDSDQVLDGDGNKINSASFTLYLFGNGTFKYEISRYAPVGVVGNYILDENKNVVLNYWFNTSSDVSLYVTKKTKTLYMDKDNNLLDNDSKYSEYGINSVKLVKSNDVNLQKYYNDFSITSILKSGICREDCFEDPNI